MLIALLLSLVAQDTTGISPRARAMLDRFPLPRPGEVSIATRFSTDTAWIGEQVELVTAAWFPRELRNRLRHTPNLLPPALNGLWSVQVQANMAMAATRTLRGQLYDLFIAHQTIFPLGGGKITVPPAILTYSVPASASFFAPEQKKTLSSRPAALVVRPIPARLTTALGSGPTARNIRLVWFGVGVPTQAGTPALLELVLSGEGNVALWPTPELTWPSGVRVYPDRTEEKSISVAGRRGGEKRFRFTVVADSEGVLSLPQVRYPYFDPGPVDVSIATANAVALVVMSGAGSAARRQPLPIGEAEDIPIASQLVLHGWPMMLVLLGLPPLLVHWHRRRRQIPSLPVVKQSPEAELRALLGSCGATSPDAVVSALRLRGVPREDAEGVRQWLVAVSRRRYGPPGADATPPPAPLARVLTRLRLVIRLSPLLLLGVAIRLGAQAAGEGVVQYRAGKYHAAARSFEQATRRTPAAVSAWRNLAAARWLDGDDIGASAAWVRALELAPRDPATRNAWHGSGGIPAEVRALAPAIPVSRDELVVIALIVWWLGWLVTLLGARRTGVVLGSLSLAFAGGALLRVWLESEHRVLLRSGAVLRVSPQTAAPSLGDGIAWSLARVERQREGWVLVTLVSGRQGWLPGSAVAPLGPLD